MLIYHPAFDAYHCAFRMLAVTSQHHSLEFSKLRILDFYLCFPAEIASVELPQNLVGIKRFTKPEKNPYRGPVSRYRTFREMESIQSAASRLLALTGLFSPTALEAGNVVRTGQALSEELQHTVMSSTKDKNEVVDFVLSKFAEIPLHGAGGLKQRTGLMEYRYDAA
jgi:hypothetical protein